MENATYLTLVLPLIFTLFLFYIPVFFKNKKINSELSVLERYPYFDALRGIVATMVFVHHSMFIYNFYSIGSFTLDGVFDYGSGSLRGAYVHFGQSAVMIFFMITGFLFFDKILHTKGRIDAFDFYQKRIKRLLPAMVSCFIIAIIVSSLISYRIPDLTLKTPLTWLSFGFLPLSSIAGASGGLLVAGVFWTLVFEVKFYLAVPSLSLISKGRIKTFSYIIITSIILYCLYFYDFLDKKTFILIMCFISGMLSASILKFDNEKLKGILTSKYASIFIISLVIFTSYKENISYDYKMLFVLSLLFLIIASGNSLLYVLRLSPLRLAGKCSYSIYILHGLVLNLVAGFIMKGMNYGWIVALSALLVMLLSLANYYLVEKPFLKK